MSKIEDQVRAINQMGAVMAEAFGKIDNSMRRFTEALTESMRRDGTP